MKTKFGKKVLPVFLSFLFLIGLMPTVAFAQESSGTTVYINGASGNDTNDGAEGSPVQTMGKALELAGDGGTIVILGTVYVRESVVIEDVTVKRGENLKSAMFYVYDPAEVTVKNAVIDGSSSITLSSGGYIFLLFEGSVLNIEPGADIGNNQVLAINVASATLNMTGGRLHDNTDGENNSNFGAAIWAYRNSVLNFTGGVIENNYSTDSGGALFLQDACQVLVDGTVFRNNRANYQGGAIFAESSNTGVSIVMNSGQIVNNYAGGYGGGIYAYYWKADVTVEINGGTISGNWDNVTEDLTAEQPDTQGALNTGIALGYDYSNSPLQYPVLKLSGSPEIKDNIFMFDEGAEGPVIEVTGKLNLNAPIAVGDNYHNVGRTVIQYADGVTPDRNDFAGDDVQYGFEVDGQELQWLMLLRVAFKTEDNLSTYDALYVYPDSLIDGNKLPVPTKTGYTLEGWKQYGQDTLWNFEQDVVTERMTLLASWKLNPPTIRIEADRTSAHPGDTITLTATPSHDLEEVTYSYVWYQDGERIEGETNATLSVNESGAYSVKVTVQTVDSADSAYVQSEAIVCTVDHMATKYPYKAPTATEPGNIEYWYCPECDTYFADEGLTEIISKTDTILAATGEQEPSKPEGSTPADTSTSDDQTGDKDNPGTGATDSPQTGDNSNIALWLAVLVAAGAGLTGTLLYSRKKRYSR